MLIFIRNFIATLLFLLPIAQIGTSSYINPQRVQVITVFDPSNYEVMRDASKIHISSRILCFHLTIDVPRKQ